MIFSGKYTNCLRARGEEEIAEQKRKEAETAPEPEKARLIREAEEHERVAEEKRAKAKLGKAECETLIEEERAKAPAVLETVTGLTVACGGVTSAGEYTGVKTVGNLTTTFTECAIAGFSCQSAGAEEGEIATNTLDGSLGVVQKEEPLTKTKVKIGLDLHPAEGSVVAEFSLRRSADRRDGVGDPRGESQQNGAHRIGKIHSEQRQTETGKIGRPAGGRVRDLAVRRSEHVVRPDAQGRTDERRKDRGQHGYLIDC